MQCRPPARVSAAFISPPKTLQPLKGLDLFPNSFAPWVRIVERAARHTVPATGPRLACFHLALLDRVAQFWATRFSNLFPNSFAPWVRIVERAARHAVPATGPRLGCFHLILQKGWKKLPPFRPLPKLLRPTDPDYRTRGQACQVAPHSASAPRCRPGETSRPANF
jgi:hypothetical protein